MEANVESMFYTRTAPWHGLGTRVAEALSSKEALQVAAVTGLNFPESYYENLLETYTKKRSHFLEGLDRIGLKHNVPQGTYFVLIDIQEFLDLP